MPLLEDALARTYIVLMTAILCEVIATTALSRSESFTRLVPSLIAAVSYTHLTLPTN